jgi:DNA repair exonuclease SbcCD nuclease subunit
MKTKFIQFADLHLGTKFSGLKDYEKIKKRKEEHREAFRKITLTISNIKKQEGLDFVLILGDLFEHESFSPDIIGFLIYGLGNLEIPVFITPGNHDPIVFDSPYLIFDWPKNVHIFKNRNFEKIKINENTYIHGIAVYPDNREKNVLKDYEIKEKDSINIVCFHGSEVDESKEYEKWGICFPFTLEDIRNLGADYSAIGHYHNVRKVPLKGEDILGFYSGNPEPTNFTEEGEKFILKVEFEKGKQPIIEKITDQQQRRYYRIEIDCSNFTTREEIKDKISEHKDKKDAIVQIVLEGYIEPNLELDLEEIDDFISRNDLFFSWQLISKIEANYSPDDVSNFPLAKEFVNLIDQEKDKFEGRERFFELAKLLGLDALFRKEIRSWDEI